MTPDLRLLLRTLATGEKPVRSLPRATLAQAEAMGLAFVSMKRSGAVASITVAGSAAIGGEG